MTTQAAIYDAMASRFEANMPFSPAVRIAAPGVGFEPDGEPYVAYSFVPVETVSPFVEADSTDVLSGTFIFTYIYPSSTPGIMAPMEAAGLIADVFSREARIFTSTGARVKIVRSPSVLGPVPAGAWSSIPVTVQYRSTTE